MWISSPINVNNLWNYLIMATLNGRIDLTIIWRQTSQMVNLSFNQVPVQNMTCMLMFIYVLAWIRIELVLQNYSFRWWVDRVMVTCLHFHQPLTATFAYVLQKRRGTKGVKTTGTHCYRRRARGKQSDTFKTWCRHRCHVCISKCKQQTLRFLRR